MNSSNTSASTCIASPSYIRAKDDAYFFVFFILTPIYFFSAFTGHILCLIGFIRRAKTEPAYAYQIYVTAGKSLEICCFTIFVISYKWLSGIESAGVGWYEQNYVLMWYAAHASTPVSNSCISTSLFLSVAMAADRLFAMWKPFVYRNVNQKKYHALTVSLCFFVGWSTSIFDWFRYDLALLGDVYKARVNTGYVGGPLGIGLANVRNVFRAGAVLALIICNIGLIRLFGRHASVNPGGATGTTDKMQAKRKSSERHLVIIVLVQSILTSITIFLFVTYYILSYADPSFFLCAGVMFASVMDGMLEISDMAIFFIVVSVDKNVRQAILATLNFKCKKNQVGSSKAVVSAITAPNTKSTGSALTRVE